MSVVGDKLDIYKEEDQYDNGQDMGLVLHPDIDNCTDFIEYKEELEKFEGYTPLTDEEKQRYEKMDALPPMGISQAKKHPYLWAKWVIGVKPRDYQWKILDSMMRSKRLAAVTARQVGKTFCIAVFCFWAAYNNINPRMIDNKTKIGVVSRTEDQAKKLLNDVVNIINRADTTYGRLAKNNKIAGFRSYFTGRYEKKPSKSKLEWVGGIIEVFPPTDSILGESLSFLIVDEADKLKTVDDLYYFWESSAMPTVKETQGAVFAFSTPKGIPTPFYEIVNPEESRPLSGWMRIWYPWTINVDGWAYGWAEREKYINKGRKIFFATEYEASFRSGAANFFDLEHLNECTYDRGPIYEWSGPVTVGIDYGSKVSRTVVSFWGLDTEFNVFKLLYYKEFQERYDNSQLPKYLDSMRNRYRIVRVIDESCPAGDTPMQLLKKAGYNLLTFKSKADKIRTYENVKIAMANGRIELYKDKDMIQQFKTIEEKETKTGYSIEKARGLRDDIVDSCMMGMSEFVKPKRYGKRRIL